jgi:hypothetical protein
LLKVVRTMKAALGAPRHRASVRVNLRALIGASSAIGAACVIAVGLSGSSYALWADNGAVAAGTVQSGSIGLSTGGTLTAASWSNMLVGESVRQPFTVTNTGTVAMTLSATATAGASFAIRVASGTCPTTDLTGTPATTSATALGTLAVGATRTLCLQVTAVTGATSGTSSAVTVTVAGAQ